MGTSSPFAIRSVARRPSRSHSRIVRSRLVFAGLLVPLAAGCPVATRLDYAHLLSRQGWQRTDEVIEILALSPGATVADLAAGDGYFSFPLADPVQRGTRSARSAPSR